MVLSQSVNHSYMAREGDALALLLNRKPKSRVARWVTFFHGQRELSLSLAQAGFRDPGISGAGAKAILGLVRVAKSKRVRVPQDFPPSRFTVSFRLEPFIRPSGEYDCRVNPTAGGYAETLLLLQLANAHQVHRLRQCKHCRKWYFARREAQRFCSVNCRVKGHVSMEPSEVRRRKRAEYMRDYRKREKDEDRMALENLKVKGDKQ